MNPFFKACSLTLVLITSLTTLQCKEEFKISEPDEKAPFHKGVVVETMNSNGYTYILMKNEAGKHFWIACLEVPVKKGDKITAPQGYIMRDFTSKTLKKTFSSILFIAGVEVDGASSDSNHSKVDSMADPKANQKASMKEFAAETKVKGKTSVNDCYKNIDSLDGKTVTVRGKVIKFLPGIMSKNWIHLQDGTGKEGANDLTVTTIAKTKVGDTIVITGKLIKDKDFGSGYKYPIMVEDALIVVE
jgi:hypothetical protein